MTLFPLLLALSVGLAEQPRPADYDGNALLRDCTAAEQFLNDANAKLSDGTTACLSYVAGFMDALAATVVLGRQKPLTMCIPGTANRGQVVRIVVKYLREHPEKLHLVAGGLTYVAISEAFPCEK